ncbi:MAG: TIGR02996 domain-containing protein [Kofleriaceae bacterium]
MTRDEELRQAIIDAPDDLDLRRIYADHLQHEGDLRGEYIALACNATDEAVPHEMRRRALWQHYGEAWKREDGFSDDALTYRNGFCEWFVTSPAQLPDQTEYLLRQPVTHLTLGSGDGERLDGLANHPLLPRIRHLTIFTSVDDPIAIADVVDAASNITELAITCYDSRTVGWDALARCSQLDRIEMLDIDATLTPRTARWLTDHLPRLKRLRLSGIVIESGALAVLAERLPILDELVIGVEELDDHAELVEAFAGPWTRALKSLVLTPVEFDATAIAHLAPTLTQLELTSQDRSFCEALSSHDWPALETLDLSDTPLDTLDLRRFAKLVSLNSDAKQDVRRIVEHAPRLSHVGIDQVDDADVDAIMTLPLVSANLSTSQITTAAIDRIAQPSPTLRTLRLAANVGAPAMARFATAGWPYIDQITLLVGADHQKTRSRFAAGWIEREQGAFYTYERKLELSGTPVPIAAEPVSFFSRVRSLFQ